MRQAPGIPLAVFWSALAAAVLSLASLPVWLMPARPDWMALWVVYWVTRQPARIGMGWAWIAGLLLDGLSGGVFGRHALALAVVAYASQILRGRMMIYTLGQQMALVFLIAAIDLVLCQWVQNLSGHATPDLWFLMGALTSALAWPIVTLGSARDEGMESWRSPH